MHPSVVEQIKPTLVSFRGARGHVIVGVVTKVKDTEAGKYLKVLEMFFYMASGNISRTDKGDTHFVSIDEPTLRLANKKEEDDAA